MKKIIMTSIMLILTLSCLSYLPTIEDTFDRISAIIDEESSIKVGDIESRSLISLDGVVFTNISKDKSPTQDTILTKTFSLLDVDESSIGIIIEDSLYLDESEFKTLREDVIFVQIDFRTGTAKLEEIFKNDKKPRVFSYETKLISFPFDTVEMAEKFKNEFIFLVRLVKEENKI